MAPTRSGSVAVAFALRLGLHFPIAISAWERGTRLLTRESGVACVPHNMLRHYAVARGAAAKSTKPSKKNHLWLRDGLGKNLSILAVFPVNSLQ